MKDGSSVPSTPAKLQSPKVLEARHPKLAGFCGGFRVLMLFCLPKPPFFLIPFSSPDPAQGTGMMRVKTRARGYINSMAHDNEEALSYVHSDEGARNKGPDVTFTEPLNLRCP